MRGGRPRRRSRPSARPAATSARCVATLVNLINPSVVVIGGALADAGESLLAGIREVVYQRSLPLATEHLRIVPRRAGERAGVLGAAALAIGHVLSPEAIEAAIEQACVQAPDGLRHPWIRVPAPRLNGVCAATPRGGRRRPARRRASCAPWRSAGRGSRRRTSTGRADAAQRGDLERSRTPSGMISASSTAGSDRTEPLHQQGDAQDRRAEQQSGTAPAR